MNQKIILIAILILFLLLGSSAFIFRTNISGLFNNISQDTEQSYYTSQREVVEPKMIKIDNPINNEIPLSIRLEGNCYCLYNNASENEKKEAIKAEDWEKDNNNICQCEMVSGDANNNISTINSGNEVNACETSPYSVTYKINTNNQGYVMKVTLSCKNNLKRCDYDVNPQGNEDAISATEYMINGKLTMCTGASGETVCITGMKTSGCQIYFDRFLSSDLAVKGSDAHVNANYYLKNNIAPTGFKNVLGTQTKCYPFSDGLSNIQQSCFNDKGVLFYSGTANDSIVNIEATEYHENIGDSLFNIPDVKIFDQSNMLGL